jgi:acyl transferase domain-containing protein/SAM-dependent methyltransferase
MTEPIAIVGMRGRFPGADTLDQFWQNLADGVESITTLTAEEVRAAGVPDHIARLPGYVKAAPLLDGVEKFDAAFFGFSSRDASMTDPQHRVFLETAWEALEDAGYDPATFPGAIGVFGGCELSSYLYQLYLNIDALGYFDGMQLMVTNDKDHLCTQVSYRLNLHGPSVVVQTTCSTSAVAIALACESLEAGRCDMALAGGATVRVPQRGGYFYMPGSILSPDGHCRPFDASAQGTIVGSAVGILVLRRLADAIADGDQVRAVILGVGLNNDGNEKAGYTAPSPRGQAAAIRDAQRNAGVPASTIGYVEAHGTGTILGDPIEFSALTNVFREDTARRGFCGIGSVKSNVGHLSCASGVTGVIKTVLALEHGAIPPTVHYRAPNPAIDFASSPFYVTTTLTPWQRNGTPRRAGVSSFGVGGTNAHLVLEEAPDRPVPEQRRPHQLLALSARTESALDDATTRLADHLEAHSEVDLADAAFTLHVGRRMFPYRRSIVVGAEERDRAVAALRDHRGATAVAASTSPAVVFMFSGQGTQYPTMAAGCYEHEPVFRRAVDHCARVLKPELGCDVRRLLFPSARRRAAAAETLLDTAFTQPALFTIEYAAAQLWRSFGVEPSAMIGHSIGEYVAATIAGVMELDDALRVVAERGRRMSSLPSGSMIGVMAPTDALTMYVDEHVSLAAVNAPGFSVLSGAHDAIERIQRELQDRSIPARRLHTSHAFHSSMMEPIVEEFEATMARVELSKPTIPYVANLTGDWANGDSTDPHLWSAQLRSTVRFADGLCTLARAHDIVGENVVFLEVGAGRTLVTFATQTLADARALPSLPGADDGVADTQVLLDAIGSLWVSGVEVDWPRFHREERRRRVSLPTYPFERQTYWIGPLPSAVPKPLEARDPAQWFYRPGWREAPLSRDLPSLRERRVLVFDDGAGVGGAVVASLLDVGAQPVVIRTGDRFARVARDEYVVNPNRPQDFIDLAREVCATEPRVAGVVHCSVSGPPAKTDLDTAAVETFLSPLRVAVALGSQRTVRPLPMLLVVRGAMRVLADDVIDPARAMGIGAARVLPQEQPGVRAAFIDIDGRDDVTDILLAELAAGAPEPSVALRAGRRYVETYEPAPIASARRPGALPSDPVVVVTGGLGHMGLILAEAMFRRLGARLVLVGRSTLPAPDEWAARADDPALADEQRKVFRRLAALHAERDDILVLKADLDDAGQVAAALDTARETFGRVDIVVHGAANTNAAAFGTVNDTNDDVVAAQLSPKVRGLLHLVDAMRPEDHVRWIVHSSISTTLGGLGLAAYAGANAVLDALCVQGGDDWLSIAWDAWDNAAEGSMAALPNPIQPEEGQEAFLRCVGADAGTRVIVAVGDFDARVHAWVRHDSPAAESASGAERHPRPALSTPYQEPRTETERRLAEIWAEHLGFDAVGVLDRFVDLGGHSLLAVQIATQIGDEFQVDLPVTQLFQAPTVSEIAPIVDRAQAGERVGDIARPDAVDEAVTIKRPESGQKAGYQDFYDDVTRRLDASGLGDASFFLNYGYVSNGHGDEARFEVPTGVVNASSVRLAFELIGAIDVKGRRVLDVGSGRGGTVTLLAERFGAEATGVDLSPEAVAFCRRAHAATGARFEVGDAEHLPFDDQTFDAVTNIESSHTYPDVRAFLAEVRRVLVADGWFLHTDLLPVERWVEVRALLDQLGFMTVSEREITPNVLASCDEVAATRAHAFGEQSTLMDNFLAVPGSTVYEQMRSGAWEYRIMRSRLTR